MVVYHTILLEERVFGALNTITVAVPLVKGTTSGFKRFISTHTTNSCVQIRAKEQRIERSREREREKTPNCYGVGVFSKPIGNRK